jgi:DNA-binding NarL/FixJ family response regulator
MSARRRPANPAPDLAAAAAASTRRVLLIDDTTLTRECLAHMLRQHASDFVVESAAQPDEAAQRPDLVLLNIKSARVDDAPVLRQLAEIRQRFDAPPVVIIADLDDSQLAMEAIRRQLRGYLPTSLSAKVLAAAISLVLAGGTFVPERLIADYVTRGPAAADGGPRDVPPDRLGLTRREREVLAQLRHGKPNKLIAYELKISESTVKVHIRNIMKKLRVTNRTQLAMSAHSAAFPPLKLLGRPAA